MGRVLEYPSTERRLPPPLRGGVGGGGPSVVDGTTPSLADILQIAATGYTLKFLIALALTPLIYAGRAFLRRRLGLTPIPAERS